MVTGAFGMSTFNNDTPAAKWRVEGQPDPHEGKYDGRRSELSLGDMTDDELANAVFTFGDVRPKVEDLIAGTAKPSIVYLTAGKERIRWLSRQLEKSLEMQAGLTRVIGERDQSLDEVKKALQECLDMAHELDSYGVIDLERRGQVEKFHQIIDGGDYAD